MAFTSGALTKLGYGSYLAAALAYLMLHQNDAAGLALSDSGDWGEPASLPAPAALQPSGRTVTIFLCKIVVQTPD